MLLHQCSSYCLRVVQTGRGDNATLECDCRMHFGQENKFLSSRTDGKPARTKNACVCRKGLLYIEPKRDHPRMVAEPLELIRAYGANADFQIILGALNDVPQVDPNQCILDIFEQYDIAINIEDQNARKIRLKNLAEVVQSRKYFNGEILCDGLIDYVVAYACKGEVSSIDSVRLFKALISSDLPPNTTFKCLAQKMGMSLLKSTTISAAQADFGNNINCKYWRSSKVFTNISLKLGSRTINDQYIENDENEGSAVNCNHFDRFLQYKIANPAEQISFHMFNSANNNIPVYSHGTFRASWPLQENFCRTMLTLHKTNIVQVADILATFENYTESFKSFLREDPANIPQGLIKSLQRAKKENELGIIHTPRNAVLDMEIIPETPPGQNHNVDDPIIDYELVEEENYPDNIFDLDLQPDFFEANIGYVPTEIDRSTYPNYTILSEWLKLNIETFYDSTNEIFTLPISGLNIDNGYFYLF